MSINLTIKEIMDLANYAGLSCDDGGLTPEDMESELTVCEKGLVGAEDDRLSAWHGAYAYFSDYPEEGCMPLNDNLITGDELVKAKLELDGGAA